MELTAKEFDPKNGNFYSKGLFQWLKKHKRYNKIYMATWNNWNGHDPENPVMMIGRIDEDGWFVGNAIKSVCRVRGDRNAFAFPAKPFFTHEWTDITEEFVSMYHARGLCHIHGDHAHDFEYLSDDEKQCRRCGDIFTAERKEVVSIETEWAKQ